MRKNSLLILWIGISASILFSGCNKKEKINNITTYLAWLNDPNNELIQTKHIHGLELKVKYMPAVYMAYLEIKDKPQCSIKHRDSILSLYKQGITFLFTLGPDENKNNKNDIMLSGVSNYKEYIEKVMTMNFEMEEYVTLKTENGTYKPVLTNLENTYGLTKSRNITVVFSDEGKSKVSTAKEYDVVYEDELFELGTNHFIFYKKDIEKLPEFTGWKNN